MYTQFNQTHVRVAHEQHRQHLAQEYQAAQRNVAFLTQQATRVAQWVNRQIANITSGMNSPDITQSGSGTLQPS